MIVIKGQRISQGSGILARRLNKLEEMHYTILSVLVVDYQYLVITREPKGLPYSETADSWWDDYR